MGQADVNTKDKVSHGSSITKHITGPSFDNQVFSINSYEVNKVIRHMVWGVLLIQYYWFNKKTAFSSNSLPDLDCIYKFSQIYLNNNTNIYYWWT